MPPKVQYYQPVIYLSTRTKITPQRIKQNLQPLHWIIHKVKDKIKINQHVKKRNYDPMSRETEDNISQHKLSHILELVNKEFKGFGLWGFFVCLFFVLKTEKKKMAVIIE